MEQAEAGAEIVIARAGKPVARLMPLASASAKPRKLGLGKGRIHLPAGFDEMNRAEVQQLFEDGQ